MKSGAKEGEATAEPSEWDKGQRFFAE